MSGSESVNSVGSMWQGFWLHCIIAPVLKIKFRFIDKEMSSSSQSLHLSLAALDTKASNLSSLSKKYRSDAKYLNTRSTYAKVAAVTVCFITLIIYVRFWWLWWTLKKALRYYGRGGPSLKTKNLNRSHYISVIFQGALRGVDVLSVLYSVLRDVNYTV